MPKDITALLRHGREILELEAVSARSVGYATTALVKATLPHSRVEGNEFVRRNGNYTRSMLAPSHIGLPYGTVPRLLLLWLTTEVVRTKSRTITLGSSMARFMGSVGVGYPSAGPRGTATMMKEQLIRLFATTISITRQQEGRYHDVGFRIADETLVFRDPIPAAVAEVKNVISIHSRMRRPPSHVRLSQPLYDEIIAHPIPA